MRQQLLRRRNGCNGDELGDLCFLYEWNGCRNGLRADDDGLHIIYFFLLFSAIFYRSFSLQFLCFLVGPFSVVLYEMRELS